MRFFLDLAWGVDGREREEEKRGKEALVFSLTLRSLCRPSPPPSAPPSIPGSICSLKGNPYVIVPEQNFRLLQGEDSLTEYRFETKKAKHLFCKVCGVQSFYRPRSNPEGVSVLVPALERGTIEGVEVGQFDGQNWEEAFAKGKPAPCE